MTVPHPSHEWSGEGIGSRCTGCGELRGGPFAHLPCKPVTFEDAPEAAAEKDLGRGVNPIESAYAAEPCHICGIPHGKPGWKFCSAPHDWRAAAETRPCDVEE